MDAIDEIRTVLERMLPRERGPFSLHEPELTDREKALVIEALDEGFVSYAGRHVVLFEKALAKACGVKEAVAMVSGTAALHAMLHVSGIGQGDEVLCPSLTFVATANAIVETTVHIAPAKNTQLMGLYDSGTMLCTQCEAEGFRRITFFPDRPDVLSRYFVRLEDDRATYPVLLANGDLAGQG